jgi:hypothetical protein
MTEDVLFVCKSPGMADKGGTMAEPEERSGTVVELMLLEPEIVAWLEDYRQPRAVEPEDDDPPRAA